MLSFGKLCNLMEGNALIGPKDDNRAMDAIRKGLDMRSNTKEGSTFVDDLMRWVSGDANAIGHLLGVDPTEVRNWRIKIKKYYDQVKLERSSEEANKQKRNRMVNTGDQTRNNNAEGPMANGRNPMQGVASVAGSAGDRDNPGTGGRP